ncbi:MAG: plasmid recombination protein [Lachnospiraceae bacterium]|nr:plasmid recombination protein [Lachnospiraceae bacterium]
MGAASYTAHVSNEKSAITTKSKLKSVANHNLRKYRSSDYSKDNIVLLYGTENLYKDVQEVYHRELDEALKVYNEKQKRADRRIDDYFDHVSGLNQDMAVEIIFQCGNMGFWEEHAGKEDKMYYVYNYTLKNLMTLLPGFKVANAVIHFDEASPHMHVVGVPVYEGYKKGLSRRVAKRNVFTKEVLSGVLQGKLRDIAEECFYFHLKERFEEKQEGRNQDLTVLEYKVAKETEKLESVALDIGRKENTLAGLRDLVELNQDMLDETKEELEEKQQEAEKTRKVLEQIKGFVGMLRLFAPTIEEYAIAVEKDGRIDAGNSFRSILYELGKLLERLKELIKEGLCWFPKLMRWKTSVGEVAPIFKDTDNGYSYSVCGYVNVETMEQYSKEAVQHEIKADKRVGTVDTLEANIEAMERDLAEIMRWKGEQKRLWQEYEEWKRR